MFTTTTLQTCGVTEKQKISESAGELKFPDFQWAKSLQMADHQGIMPTPPGKLHVPAFTDD